MSALTEFDLGGPSGYASVGKPVGGHSIDLLESGLLFMQGDCVPGLFLVYISGVLTT